MYKITFCLLKHMCTNLKSHNQKKKQSVNQLQIRWTFLYPLRTLWFVSSVQPVETITCGDAKILNQHVHWLMRLGVIHIWCLAKIFIFTTSQLLYTTSMRPHFFHVFLDNLICACPLRASHPALAQQFCDSGTDHYCSVACNKCDNNQNIIMLIGGKKKFPGTNHIFFQLFKILALLPM